MVLLSLSNELICACTEDRAVTEFDWHRSLIYDWDMLHYFYYKNIILYDILLLTIVLLVTNW